MKTVTIDVRPLTDTLGDFTQTWKSGKELKYRFVSADKLVADFFEDVKRWRDENSND